MASDKPWKALGTGKLATQDANKGLGHIVPVKVYNAVFFSLLLLTFITVWAAAQQVGVITHIIVALTIATIKAGIVTLIFMHLQYESKVIWGIVIYPLFIFILMVIGTMGDASVKEFAVPAGVSPSDVRRTPAVELHDNHGQQKHDGKASSH
jgi:cytochrome c oxidase subunit 4